MERNLHDVVEVLRLGRRYNRACSLLIGAGCSVTAGIPTASGFVELIRREHPGAYDRAEQKTYPYCMAEIDSGTRHDIIKEQIRGARVNWAHVAIAQLIAHSYVDRVLTTNFDPLVARACAMVGEFPAVYDFAAAQLFKPAEVAEKAIFHLHGQSTGFVLMNTKKECAAHGKRLKPLFSDAARGRRWVVVGYSGDNDPVFDRLAEAKRFERGLYWVGYKDSCPSRALASRLLSEDRQAYYVKGYDADGFFVELAQRLECFPPDFVERPFTHLRQILGSLTEFSLPARTDESAGLYTLRQDLLSKARKLIDEAILERESSGSDEHRSANPARDQRSDVAPELSAAALLMAGKYEEACQKYEEAARLNPGMEEPVYNWGVALHAWARTKKGTEADKLFSDANDKYAACVRIKPDMHDAFYSWGNNLYVWACGKAQDDADQLLMEAAEKYAEAARLRPDMNEAFYNWGTALAARARIHGGVAADLLFHQAVEKYAEALRLKPDDHEVLCNWGTALCTLAASKEDGEAQELYDKAAEKYEGAVKIKPDMHEAYFNWGGMLASRAQHYEGAQKESMLDEAEEKLRHAEGLKRGSGSYNLACIASLRAREQDCQHWLQTARECETLPVRTQLESDPDLAPIRGTDWFRDFVASL